MPKFNGWYFQCDNDGFTAIVSKEFWDEHECLNDCHIEEEVRSVLPEGFFEVCESMFESDLTGTEAREKLIEAGFKEMELFPEEE